jgi:large subunit ribosomal protein L17
MKHRKSVLKLNRTSSHRKAMFRNNKIKTTEAKAKGLRKIADKMVTLAKRGDLHARRQALLVIREKNVVHTLFNEVAEKFNSRQGGYTRITKLGPRKGDVASMAQIELIFD